ncbi:MAG: GDP-mannose 4,6-dehydratase [Isosphaeraceae bacterium]
MRCLVTGAAGFIGSHLVEFLAASGHEVTGLGRAWTPALDEAGGGFAFTFAAADLCDRRAVGALLDATRPEVVFHLAAQSYPGVSWKEPGRTFEVNVLGTIGLFEALLERKRAPRVVMPGSSSEYAPSRDGRPIGEDDPLAASSPYAVSKLAQDELGRLYHAYHGLAVIRCRPFFLIGPRKEGDAASDFARGVVAIECGLADSLPVGNLDVVRDLLDVRDGVEALWTLAQRGRPGEVYNICSGTGHSLREVLSIYQGLARTEVRERIDPARIRPIEEMVKIGDPARLAALGWSPRRPIRRTLEEILNYWRDREARRAADDRRRTDP